MIVTGRYLQPGAVMITLSGTAFSQPVAYQYNLTLADSMVVSYQFLPKLWAKQKIEYLLIRYYSLDPNSPAAQALKTEIIALSIAYGVISPFTSFTGGGGTTDVESEDGAAIETPSSAFQLLGNYPNPFNPSTTIKIKLNVNYVGPVEIRICNVLGQVVKILTLDVTGRGIYEIEWDGHLENGIAATSGNYFYVVELENTILVGKMTLLK
jgi:hypothetical protein